MVSGGRGGGACGGRRNPGVSPPGRGYGAGRDLWLCFLVYENWYATEIHKILEQNVEQLGADLGLLGKAVRAYDRASKETYAEVKGKAWPADIQQRIDEDQDPFMLVVRTNFATFDPQRDPWAMIWFSDFRSDPEAIPRTFGTIARKVRAGEDIFRYLASLTEPGRVETGVASLKTEAPQPAQSDRRSVDTQAGVDSLAEEPQPARTTGQGKGSREPARDEPDPGLINDAEVARLLSMSPSWVRKQRFNRRHSLQHHLDIDHVMVGSVPRYRRSDVLAWLETRNR